jgi:hypothetical protein
MYLVFKKNTILLLRHAVAQLVQALRYKSVGREFNSHWCHWKFFFTQSVRTHYGPWVDSAPARNEYQEYFLDCKGGRCVRLKTLPPSSGSLNLLEPYCLCKNFKLLIKELWPIPRELRRVVNWQAWCISTQYKEPRNVKPTIFTGIEKRDSNTPPY